MARAADGGDPCAVLCRPAVLAVVVAVLAGWWLLGTSTEHTPPAAGDSGDPLDVFVPDRIRTSARRPEARELRCGQAIPPHSVTTTHGLEVFCQSFAQGRHGDEWAWTYRLTFRNRGPAAVQLLSRHWLFVCATGRVHEVKGPGARGAMPVIQPGGEHKYESGTTLPTDRGSMRGSFQFARRGSDRANPTTDPTASAVPLLFSAPVGRLALSPDGGPVNVPCADGAAAPTHIPPTSVAVAHRIIVGATSEPAEAQPVENVQARGRGRATAPWGESNAHGPRTTYLLDVQVNNARDDPILLLGRGWRVVDEAGGVAASNSRAESLYSDQGHPSAHRAVAPGGALRFHMVVSLPTPPQPRAVAYGHLHVCLGRGGTLRGCGDYDGDGGADGAWGDDVGERHRDVDMDRGMQGAFSGDTDGRVKERRVVRVPIAPLALTANETAVDADEFPPGAREELLSLHDAEAASDPAA